MKVKVEKMKIEKIGEPTVVMSNPYGKAAYFGWPSVARLQNGKIAVVASGYRYEHICPFGKAVISYSENEGETYTVPAPVIDTPLDDRDAGILTFGESGVMVTSFNNSVAFQREQARYGVRCGHHDEQSADFYEKALDKVTPEDESSCLGSEFRISYDCGVTFGELYNSPVTSPHGPCVLHDGSILWVGRVFSANDSFSDGESVKAYKINTDGSFEFVGAIPNICENGVKLDSCEPHAIELPDGKMICHIRVQRYEETRQTHFTTYQSEALDGGKNWTEPHRILDVMGGAPSHLMLHSSGVLIASYGYRERPYGVKVMFSYDNGETWDVGHDIYSTDVGGDLGYPCTIELKDGSLLTVFYTCRRVYTPCVIMQQKWRFEK